MKLSKAQFQDLINDIKKIAYKNVATMEDHSILRVRCDHLQDHLNALDDDDSGSNPGNPPPPPPPPPGPSH